MSEQVEEKNHESLFLRWENFKAFKDTGEVEIKPLTILLGANNSGKTTFLMPLLLLRQTIDSRDPRVALAPKGPLADAGKVADIVHYRQENAEVRFHVRFHSWHDPKLTTDPIGAYPPQACEMAFARKSATSFALKSFVVRDAYRRVMVRRDLQPDGKFSLILPKEMQQEPSSREYWEKVSDAHPTHFVFDPESLILHFFERKFPPFHEPEGHQDDTPLPPATVGLQAQLRLPQDLNFYAVTTATLYADITNLLREITYLGPMRERAKRLYEASNEPPVGIGVRGEYAPEILHRNTSNLQADVSMWLDRFGFARHVESQENEDGFFSIWVRRSLESPPVNLADCGFGVSQVFPFIIFASQRKQNRLLLAEQPEVHLNPKQQALLGDLFAACLKNRQRVLVETHSEHLLLRIRTLIAKGDISASDVALYYVERKDAETQIREVPIDETGHIKPEDWPAGFFEDSLKGALALTKHQSSRRAADGRSGN